MNLLFRRNKPDDTESTQETPKKKVRGKPFVHGDDPRRHITGRPKLGATLGARYRNALAEAESDARGGSYSKLDAMIDILIGKAMEGDQRAIEYLQERGFGKVPDRLELSKETEGEQEQYDWSLLTLDERKYMMYLFEKAEGKQPEHFEEWDGAVRYRLVLTKERVEPVDLIEATIKEETDAP